MMGLVGSEQSGAQDAQSWGNQEGRGGPSCGAGKAEGVPGGPRDLEVTSVMPLGPQSGYDPSPHPLSVACHTAAPSPCSPPPSQAGRGGRDSVCVPLVLVSLLLN